MIKNVITQIITPCVIFLLVFFVAINFSRVGVDPHHDGIIFKPAFDVVNGKILFKESYTPYGGLSTTINSIALTLLGNKLLVLKYTIALFYSFTAVLIWLVSRRFLSYWPSAFTVVIWICSAQFFTDPFYPWPSVYGTFFLLLGGYILLFTYVETKKNYWGNQLLLVLTGLMFGFAFWCKQPYLITLPIVGSYFYLLSHLKIISFWHAIQNYISVLAGFILISFLFLTWILLQGAFTDWYLQSIRLGYIMGRVFGTGFDPLYLITYLFLHPLYLLIPTACAYVFYKNFNQLRQTKISSSLVNSFSFIFLSTGSLILSYPIYDNSHLYWSNTPAFILLGILLNDLYRKTFQTTRNRKIKQINVYPIAFIILLIMILYILSRNVISGINKLNTQSVTVQSPKILSGMKVTSNQHDYFFTLNKEITTYLILHPKKEFVILGNDSLYMAMTDKAHSTGPLYLDFSNFTSKIYPYTLQLNNYIDRQKPLILMTRTKSSIPAGYYIIKTWPEFQTTLVGPH